MERGWGTRVERAGIQAQIADLGWFGPENLGVCLGPPTRFQAQIACLG